MKYHQASRRRPRLTTWISAHPLAIAPAYAAFYFPAFLYLEHRVPAGYSIIHCALDDALPFCSAFVVPYLSWFLLIPGALLYFVRRDRARYYELCWLLFGGMTVSLLLYFLFPNRILLRRPVPGDGLCDQLVLFLRQVDTPTNVCPSIHVSSTVAVMMTAERSLRLHAHPGLRRGIRLHGLCICLSTVLLDQHSVVDVVCGTAVAMSLDLAASIWRRRRAAVLSPTSAEPSENQQIRPPEFVFLPKIFSRLHWVLTIFRHPI